MTSGDRPPRAHETGLAILEAQTDDARRNIRTRTAARRGHAQRTRLQHHRDADAVGADVLPPPIARLLEPAIDCFEQRRPARDAATVDAPQRAGLEAVVALTVEAEVARDDVRDEAC